MNVQYITIEREYGSGGTEIGEKTGRMCSVPCYGRQILEKVAEKQKVSPEALEECEEKVSGTLPYSMLVMSRSQSGDPDLLSYEAKLFVAESRVIKSLAAEGPAIFVGHCASEALKDQDGVVRVFIHASEPFKRERAAGHYGIPERSVTSVCRRFNKKRASYYTFCTGKKWKDPRRYDLVLSSSSLGIDGCCRVLASLFSDGK